MKIDVIVLGVGKMIFKTKIRTISGKVYVHYLNYYDMYLLFMKMDKSVELEIGETRIFTHEIASVNTRVLRISEMRDVEYEQRNQEID